ncbi:Flp pilus assembly complex ATPase component TadA [Stieleria sp. TO1_6]|uniref:GspE/PulE family protein n=1 Tax=Stieleria tagensis TaxID=2956795 RepID=UPI00209B8CE3|nr:ATPase, T2SS/T4P/T4SS family [Stieleria tagensis]MCO8121769.1 Flp pilus assembly complex ATPase component TadA [Stieleria tagensis]
MSNPQTNESSDSDATQIARRLRMPVVADLSEFVPAPTFLQRISIAHARAHHVLGLQDRSGDDLWLAIDSPAGYDHLDTIARALAQQPDGTFQRVRLRPLPATPTAIERAINSAYSDQSSQTQTVIDSLDREALLGQIAGLGPREDLLDTEGRAPIIRLVNHLLFDAVKSGASDVHIQPYDDRLVVRQRIDGVLFDAFEIPKRAQEEVLSRVKVLGKMNIAEKRLPQDGRATVQLGDRTVDLRIASLPTSHNERIVIRLLDKSARLYSLAELGMPIHDFRRFASLISRDHGLILVTGPTGSGKSTTLYGALQEIDSEELNVLTLEDPIEYQLNGISQTQINEKKGMTFASGMRSVLRQDPDIIMVGEIRDSETAMMAIQASLTGHLVFSTLHTNDAASAVTRLLDLGTEPYLVSSSLVASLAQRLVRKLCDHCKRPRRGGDSLPDVPAELLRSIDRQPSDLIGVYEAVGCKACRGTGFKGRVGLFELLVIDDACRELVQSRANAAAIRQAGLDSGMHLLSTDGLLKVHQGITTLDEVLRVTTL